MTTIENTFNEFIFALKENFTKKRRRRQRQKQPSDPVSHYVQQIDFNFTFRFLHFSVRCFFSKHERHRHRLLRWLVDFSSFFLFFLV